MAGHLSSERARELGRRGGRVSAHRRRKLTVDDIEEAFGPLDTLEDAMRRLDKLSVWITAGLLPGAGGHAAVRSIEVWVRAHESKLTRQVVDELRARIGELEGQLRERPRLRGVP